MTEPRGLRVGYKASAEQFAPGELAGYAARAWRSWYRKAMRSRIEPLRRFARNLRPYLAGILAHCHWPLGTNLVEGINNKIKVIKRMAYGYRDDAYFFLKIRAAFPGIGR